MSAVGERRLVWLPLLPLALAPVLLDAEVPCPPRGLVTASACFVR